MKKFKKSIFIQILGSFIVAILLTIFITSIFGNVMVKRNMSSYFQEVHKEKLGKIVKWINQNEDYETIEEAVRFIKESELFNGYYIKIKDSEGNEIIEINTEKSLLSGANDDKSDKNKPERGRYISEVVPLKNGDKLLGHIVIGYYNEGFTKSQINFKNRMINSLIILAITAVIIGSLLSYKFSKNLSIPIRKVTKTAEEISSGNLNARSEVESDTEEIRRLSNTINFLGESLEKEELLKSRLTSDLAHEIRTPLTTLQNNIEAFIDGIWEPTEERLKSCHEEIIRLTTLIKKFDYIYSMEENLEKENLLKFDILKESESIVEFFKPMLLKKKIQINIEGEYGIEVYMDRDKLSQILINLLSNAYRYNNVGGKIQVEIYKEEKELILCVEDTGIGIDNKDVKYVFERLYRTDLSRSRESGGSGIGLTIVKKCVEAYKGKINIESTLGKGSKFIVKLPLENIIYK